MERQTSASLFKTTVLVNNYSQDRDRSMPADDGAFRYCDFLGSRTGYPSRAAAVAIPGFVKPNADAGSAVTDVRRRSEPYFLPSTASASRAARTPEA